MLEPDSLALLVILLLVAGAAVRLATLRPRFPGHRILAGGVALGLAFAAGILDVNRHYGYYRTWGDLVTDLTGGPQVDTDVAAASTTKSPAAPASGPAGRLVQLPLPGPLSQLSRTGYVWLPPGYPALAAAGTQLPVLMLVHGSPGRAADWITALHIDRVLDLETDRHRIGPMVVVLVPANAVRKEREECVNAVDGVQDGTYVAEDIPTDIAARFDVPPPGASWGIGGFSSGGYCAANLALQHPSSFGAVIDLDGYLRPSESGVEGQLFHGDVAAENANDIVRELQRGVPSPLPAFFLASGNDREDEGDALLLQKLLDRHESVPLLVEHGAQHSFYAWEAALPGSLDWAWHTLATPALQRQFPTLNPATPGRADVAVGAPRRRPHPRVTLPPPPRRARAV